MRILNVFLKSHRIHRIFYPILAIMVILMICLAMSVQFQHSTLVTLNEENAAFVNQVNTTASIMETMIQSYATQIYHSKKVELLRTSKDLDNFEMILAMREVNSYDVLCPFIDSVYLYNGKQDYIYSTTSSSQFGSDITARFKDATAVELFKTMSPELKLVPIYRYNHGCSSYYKNDYVYSYMLFDVDKNRQVGDNAIMMNIAASQFNELLFGETGYTQWIIDTNGKIIACSNWDSPLTDRQQQSISSIHQEIGNASINGYFKTGNSRDDEVYFYAQMGGKPWYYVRAIPYADCMNELLVVQRVVWVAISVILTIFVIAFVGTLITVWFPYRKLVTGISQLDGVSDETEDTDHLIDQLHTLVDRSKDIERLNNNFREMIQEETVRNILFGSQRGQFDQNVAHEYGMPLNPNAPVALIYVSSIRLNVYLECARRHTPLSNGAVIANQYAILLVQCSPEALLRICSDIEQASPHRWILYTAPCEDWSQLSGLHDMLRRLYERRFLYSPERILSTALLEQVQDSADLPNTQEIAQHLRKGNLAPALQQYESNAALLRNMPVKSVRAYFQSLFKDIMQLYDKFLPEAQQTEYQKAFDVLMHDAESLDDIGSLFTQLFKEIAESVRFNQGKKRGDIISAVYQLIEEHVGDENLNSQMLAETMEMSSAYLCRVFRTETGISLTDYINKARISHACTLLKTTDMSIREIAEQTGFSSEKYFYVIFKKHMDTTPKQYRQG